MLAPRRRAWHWLVLLAVAVAFGATYGRALGLFFTADDFVLLQYVKETSAGEIVRTRLLALPRDDLTSPYWRPGWLLLLDAVHAGFGLEPRAFRAVVFALHALLALGVFTVARRWLVRWPMLAAGAAALFSLSPAYAEALTWVAAGTNVLPAAACLFAAGFAYARFVETRLASRLGVAAAAFLLAFTFREAAYHMPLVVLAAHLCLEDGRLGRRLWRGVLHALPFGVVVLLHNRWLNPFAVGNATLLENLHLTARHGAAWLRLLFALPEGPVAIALALVSLAALACVLPPRGRFCLAWAVAASFPFVARSHATRFLFFVHAPLALFAAALADRLAGSSAWRARAAAAALIALAALGASRVPEAIAPARAGSAVAADFVDLVRREHLAERREVHLDFVPPELYEGLPALIELYGGGRPRVVDHKVVKRPPFLIHLEPEFADLPPEQEILHWDHERAAFTPLSKRELVSDLQPVPMFGFRHRLQVVDDWRQVRFDPDTVHLRAPPQPPLDLTGSGTASIVGYAGGTLSRFDLTVEAPRDAFLVVAFLADLTSVGGRAFVDGVEVPLLTADGMFNAVPVRAGSRHVVLKTDL